MKSSNYEIRYLPQFYEDLRKIVIYISKVLNNTIAANKLIDSVETVSVLSRHSMVLLIEYLEIVDEMISRKQGRINRSLIAVLLQKF